MRVEVAIALVWRKGQLLISRRRKAAHLGGLWEFPGGRRRPDESFEQCAEREVFEETRVICRAYGKRPPIAHDYPDKRLLLCPVDCHFVEGRARAHEVAAVRWVVPLELSGFEFPAANSALIRTLIAQSSLNPQR